MLDITSINIGKLARAVKIKQRIQELEGKLQNLLSGEKRTHNVSPEGRRKISRAVKRYWQQRRLSS